MKLKVSRGGKSILLAMFASFLVSANAAFGQATAPDESPEAVGEKSFIAMREGRAEDFAHLTHPDELKRFKDFMLIVVDMART